MRIAVAGGTGAVGQYVVNEVRAAGHEPVVLSRSTGVDVISGAGLATALAGASSVIDVSATSATSTRDSVQFFGTATRNLLAAERKAQIPHHVALSVIGAGKVNANYYAGKVAQEGLLMAQENSWSLLRTTQFHEFAVQLVQHGKIGPLQVVPTMWSQPIAAAEVARELVQIALGEPRGLEPDLAGPQEERMADLVKRYLNAIAGSRPVLQVPLPGPWGRGMRDGSLLPAAGTRVAGPTFAQWLSDIARQSLR